MEPRNLMLATQIVVGLWGVDVRLTMDYIVIHGMTNEQTK